MSADNMQWWAWLVAIAVGLPWIVPMIWYWRRRPRQDGVPPSMAEMARERLWRR